MNRPTYHPTVRRVPVSPPRDTVVDAMKAWLDANRDKVEDIADGELTFAWGRHCGAEVARLNVCCAVRG